MPAFTAIADAWPKAQASGEHPCRSKGSTKSANKRNWTEAHINCVNNSTWSFWCILQASATPLCVAQQQLYSSLVFLNSPQTAFSQKSTCVSIVHRHIWTTEKILQAGHIAKTLWSKSEILCINTKLHNIYRLSVIQQLYTFTFKKHLAFQLFAKFACFNYFRILYSTCGFARFAQQIMFLQNLHGPFGNVLKRFPLENVVSQNFQALRPMLSRSEQPIMTNDVCHFCPQL